MSSRPRSVPPRAMSCCPAQAVTPVESSASPTTNSVAMKMTVGSPKPASAWFRSRMPVSHNETDTPIATIPNGIRFDMKATTASARMTNVVATGLMRATLDPGDAGRPRVPVTGARQRARVGSADLWSHTMSRNPSLLIPADYSPVPSEATDVDVSAVGRPRPVGPRRRRRARARRRRPAGRPGHRPRPGGADRRRVRRRRSARPSSSPASARRCSCSSVPGRPARSTRPRLRDAAAAAARADVAHRRAGSASGCRRPASARRTPARPPPRAPCSRATGSPRCARRTPRSR